MTAAFAQLTRTGLEDCAHRATRRTFGRGDVIFHQGDRPTRFHTMVAGWVRILQAGPDGEVSAIRFVGQGELFGAFALFGGAGYPADAIAAEDVVELSWSESDMRMLIDSYPVIAVNLLNIAAQRLAELQDRVRELSTQSAEQRIANALMRLASTCSLQSSAAPLDIGSPLARKDVATLSGTTLHTASRILSRWTRCGIISSASRHISIALPSELRRIARGG